MTPGSIPPRVLVAAREGPARERILQVLEELGAEVTAVDALPALFEALGKLVVDRVRTPDAVLVGDLAEGEGLEALRILRRGGWTTPFVLVGRAREAEARALGAVVLDEAFEAEALSRALRGWLEETGPWPCAANVETPGRGAAR